MTEEVYRALSSKSRAEILRLLYKKPRDIEELAEKLKLQPITVRHHVQALLEVGLIESYEERSGAAGRPKAYYRIAKSLPIVSFPKRRYLTFSSFLVDAIKDALGEETTSKILAKAGRDMGKKIVKQLEYENNVKEWTPKEFEEVFFKKYLQEAGTEPEIVEKSNKRIVYRLHNCIFFELALKMPELMCDVLHKQFHDGVSAAMGKNVKDTQTTCMGHGGDYCEHVIEWR